MYKPDLAVTTRWACATSLLALAAFGSYRLYYSAPRSWRLPIDWMGLGSVLGTEFPITIAVLLAGGFLIGSVVGTYYLLNWPLIVDFFVEVEQEMSKVAWASSEEVTGSSLVVILTVIILAGWITLVDTVIILIRRFLVG